jgi:hypothetical protein
MHESQNLYKANWLKLCSGEYWNDILREREATVRDSISQQNWGSCSNLQNPFFRIDNTVHHNIDRPIY